MTNPASPRRAPQARAVAWRLGLAGGAVALLVAVGCSPSAQGSDAGATGGAGPGTGGASGLTLLRERKISKIVGDTLDHYEASGLLLLDGKLYVAMDNTFALAVLTPDLLSGSLAGSTAGPSQYEAVTVCPAPSTSLCVLEETDGQPVPHGVVVETGADGTPQATWTSDVAFANPNRGFEGLALVQSQDGPRLLALCEGNRCLDDVDSEGLGQIQILALREGALTSVGSLAVPARARFHDFSDLTVRARADGDYDVAVVSQVSSALWLGRLSTSLWQFVGDGQVYGFPRTSQGLTQYCNVEGVAFLDQNKVVIASDKSDGTAPCNDKDESISVFVLP